MGIGNILTSVGEFKFPAFFPDEVQDVSFFWHGFVARVSRYITSAKYFAGVCGLLSILKLKAKTFLGGTRFGTSPY